MFRRRFTPCSGLALVAVLSAACAEVPSAPPEIGLDPVSLGAMEASPRHASQDAAPSWSTAGHFIRINESIPGFAGAFFDGGDLVIRMTDDTYQTTARTAVLALLEGRDLTHTTESGSNRRITNGASSWTTTKTCFLFLTSPASHTRARMQRETAS
jgi:hypothetical protein